MSRRFAVSRLQSINHNSGPCLLVLSLLALGSVAGCQSTRTQSQTDFRSQSASETAPASTSIPKRDASADAAANSEELITDAGTSNDKPPTSFAQGLAVSDLVDDDATCVALQRQADVSPVAFYLMLDSSGSMEEPTAGISTKWEAIQRAIRIFMSDSRDSALYMGLQYFPLLKPGTQFNCESHNDCGADGGPCYLSTCLLGDTIALCRSTADCPGAGNDCVPFGLCSNSDPDSGIACLLSRGDCGNDADGNSLGTCDDFERVCTNSTSCDSAQYQQPAVEIGPIAERLAEVDASLTARPLQGLTPMAPALEGALAQAEQWAQSHPEQKVVVVLATDGLPTECGDEPEAIAALAAAALEGEHAIQTLVIGVFQPEDTLSQENAQAIALAGGSGEALLIETSEDVSAKFAEALSQIGKGEVACQIDLEQGSAEIDFSRARVALSNGVESTQPLTFVSSSADCSDSPQSWYYERPSPQSAPTSVHLCPEDCNSLQTSTDLGFTIALGCLAETP